jgi:integrase
MGHVFKPFVTRPLPAGSTLAMRAGKRVAVWTDDAGKKRQAAVTDGDTPRIRQRASTYTAQYRDGSGIRRRVATGCKSRDAARSVLADLEARAEKVLSGIVTAAEESVAEHAGTPVVEHVDAYVAVLACRRGKGAKRTVAPAHVANVARTLRLAADECGFRRLRDLNREAVERWVGRLLDAPDGERLAPRTINARLAALTSWGNWLVESGRLTANPFARLRKTAGLDESDDVRRQRRALTADELRRLLTVARLRPVAEHGRATVRVVDADRPAKSRATWKKVELTFETIAAAAERGRSRLRADVLERLERAGRERALFYTVLVTTGLRKGELGALTVADVLLDGDRPAITLKAADAKNGQRATLPLRGDVAEELRAWIEERTEAVCPAGIGVAGVVNPRADVPLFNVPDKLVKILNRDLAAAGIPKRDDRGRTVDVHAFRGTFASHLAAAGVQPVTLQTLMRHSRLETTLKHYTDPRLLDVAGAVETLPALTVDMPEVWRATGTDYACAVAPVVAPPTGRDRQNVSLCGKFDDCEEQPTQKQNPRKTAVSRGFSEMRGMGDIGLEPMTPSLSSDGSVVLSAENKGLTAPADSRCTVRCTSPADRLNELARVVALVARLPGTDDDRSKLLERAAELLGEPQAGES